MAAACGDGNYRAKAARIVTAQARGGQGTVPRPAEPGGTGDGNFARRDVGRRCRQYAQSTLLPTQKHMRKVLLHISSAVDQQHVGNAVGTEECRRRKVLREHDPAVVKFSW